MEMQEWLGRGSMRSEYLGSMNREGMKVGKVI